MAKKIVIETTPMVVEVPEPADLVPAREPGVELSEVLPSSLGIRRFLVELRDVKPLTIEAADEDDAAALFKDHYGIIDSDHEFKVTEVT